MVKIMTYLSETGLVLYVQLYIFVFLQGRFVLVLLHLTWLKVRV